MKEWIDSVGIIKFVSVYLKEGTGISIFEELETASFQGLEVAVALNFSKSLPSILLLVYPHPGRCFILTFVIRDCSYFE